MRPHTLFALFFALFISFVASTDVPINLVGAFDDATATDTSYNTGGTISVNGWTVTVPKNMMVTFPAAFVPWKEFVAQKDFVAGFEVTLVGNIVDGVPLAAQIHMSEFTLEINQGYIDTLDADGRIKIRNGPYIRINDPNAVFSAGFSAPFMVADDVNPSVTAFSGFPMCVPRSTNDTLCPTSNRPTVSGTTQPQRIFQAPDALVMAPLLVNDFIEYVGYKASNGEVICYEIAALNVQITTTGAPTYIRVEDALIGVYTGNANAEVAESRFIAYTSDPSVSLSISAIDIDPCTGLTSSRSVGVGVLRPEVGGRNKYVARFDNVQGTQYTREYVFQTSNGAVETRNGLFAGRYVTPVTEWIQPELLVPGIEPIPNEFQLFSHLTRGIGPDADGNMWGPLSPFPQSGVTVFDTETCEQLPPVVPGVPVGSTSATLAMGTSGSTTTAQTSIFARRDDTVRLTGTHTNANAPAFVNDTIVFGWALVEESSAGTLAHLSQFSVGNTTAAATVRFTSTAPAGDYLFRLSISSVNNNSTGTADFTVKLFTGADTVTVEAVTWSSSQSGTISITCRSDYFVDSKVSMQVIHPGDGAATTAAMSANPPGTGTWVFSSRRVDQPGVVTCNSALGGTATRTGTTV